VSSGRINIGPLSELEPAPARRGFRLAPRDGMGMASNADVVFDLPAARLWQAWLMVAARQPRTTLIALDADRHRSVHVQQSRVFRFQDRVRAEIVEFDRRRCGLAIDSRSLLGYYDLGVNRRRVLMWLAELREALRVAP